MTPNEGMPPNHSRKSRGRSSGTKKSEGEVIHVAFGPGGGRIQHAAEAPRSPLVPPVANNAKGNTKSDAQNANAANARCDDTNAAALPPPKTGEPITDVFSPREVEKLLGLRLPRLRSLDKAEIVSPSAMRNGRRAYTFQDLIALRAAHDLLARRVRIKDVAEAIFALRRALPRVTRPLQELRIVSDGRKVVVQVDGTVFEPVSGQIMLDFRVDNLRTDVVRVLRQNSASRSNCAFDLYVRASSLDEDPASFEQAVALYEKAILLDPSLAIAYTNLGNVRFRMGDELGAEELYRRALEIDTRQPEAHYNLGYVLLERGLAKEAVSYFEAAIKSDPRFADAHYNLAMAYESLGDKARARVHWKVYLDVEPAGAWADIARGHL
ncbi:MAG: tetratricopeptide repeat protein [Polyangiaceae bacterium]|nr:tetratricopeptide repeat protein [Polyangiaceae bacterium]